MEHFRIIVPSSPEHPDVLIHRVASDSGKHIVEIKAIGVIDGVEDVYLLEAVSFESVEMACRYIEDFNPRSADEWVKINNITNSLPDKKQSKK